MLRAFVDRKNSSTSVVLENKDYKENMNHAICYLRRLLRFIGVWSLVKKNRERRDIVIAVLLIILATLLPSFVMVPCILHALLREQNPNKKMKLLAPIGLRAANCVKYYAMLNRLDALKFCFKQVETDWMTVSTLADRQIMRKKAILGRRITILCIMVFYTSTLSYNAILPIWRGSKINEFNKTIRPVVYPGYDIFVDPQASPTYEIIFCTTVFAACSTYTVISGSCSLAATFVTHACGQIEIIISRLKTIFDNLQGNDHRLLNDRISFIVRRHVRVLSMTEKIEELLKEICLLEVVSSTLIMCLLGYYFMMEWENADIAAMFPYFLVLFSLSLNVFVFCQIGEILTEQCAEIGKAVYMIDWYDMPGKTGLALILVIAMANIPRKLTAGGMIDLSVASFGAIIKTSAVYFNMLRAMDE
ncbi:odorant receptor Or2-like [Venturia canescens]|uniref:odorant receptor Or2-like n=1 Tax=Venturia canescens TaxID=32260 RepID=UPI001C9CBBE3|nr:odorant receptor Or2-like [Venturia canescens]